MSMDDNSLTLCFYAIFSAILLALLFYAILLNKRLNTLSEYHKISLLTIQQYCVSMNRAINKLIEMDKENMQKLMEYNDKLLTQTRLAHIRVKTAYTGIFRHLDIEKLKRAPRAKIDGNMSKDKGITDARNDIIKEVMNEMLETEFARHL